MRQLIWILCVFGLAGCAGTEKQNRERADLYLRMGASHIEAGNYPFALRDLLKSEEYNPKNPATQNNLGLVYFMREKYDLSVQHFKKALELDPQFSDSRNNLARVYIEQGKFKDAEDELKKVLNDLTYPTPEKAYINLGLAKFNQKQFQAALHFFSKVLQSHPDDCIANTYRGRSLFEMKDYGTAAEALDRAIGFCQKNLYDEPHYYSALTYYRLGNKAKATARFEEIIKLYPNGNYREKSKGMLELLRKGH